MIAARGLTKHYGSKTAVAQLSFDVRPYPPDRTGADMISNHGFPGAFSPWIGVLILCGYAAAALVIGGVLLVRGDA